ncbi:MAG TPA: cupin domain-containing protein, partial [Arenibaculum sp.]|nr:cupin domain-containing protein [Arenibaculum sp.]
DYCRPAVDREGREAMMADLEKVGTWLRRGASLVCNDIDSLTPGLKSAANALEQGLGGKAQANLYCSWRAHQAFGSHFDTHDVYAFHFEGEKTWRIYGRHFEDPVAHPAFKSQDQSFHDAHKGPVSMEVNLKPGDILYIPRGWYHDALASSAATFHVAFGVTSVIGLDFLSMLFERAVQDPAFRANVPRDADELARHLAELGERAAAFAREPETVRRFAGFVEGFRYRRAGLDLPGDALARRWRVRAGIRVFTGPDGPRLGDSKRSVRVPPPMQAAVAWAVERREFSDAEFEAAFPALAQTVRDKILADLANMKVVEAA